MLILHVYCVYSMRLHLVPRQVKEKLVWVQMKGSIDSLTLILPININVVQRLCPSFEMLPRCVFELDTPDLQRIKSTGWIKRDSLP